MDLLALFQCRLIFTYFSQKSKLLNSWVKAERTMIVEKFKRSRTAIKSAQQQQASVSVDDTTIMHFPARQTDTVSSVDSDVAMVRLELLEPDKVEGIDVPRPMCTTIELLFASLS